MISMFRRIFGGILLIYLGSSYADDIPPPPYQLGNGQFIFIGVEWDEQTIKDFLPKELKPVAGMTGGINIYYTKTSDPINWEAGYYWIDVEGFDAPDGTKGRFILAGQYGPATTMANIVTETYAFNHVRVGSARHKIDGDLLSSYMQIAGKDLVETQIRFTGQCTSTDYKNSLFYVNENDQSENVVLKIPYELHMVCPASPVTVKVSAAGMDPYSKIKFNKLTWAVFATGSSSWLAPTIGK